MESVRKFGLHSAIFELTPIICLYNSNKIFSTERFLKVLKVFDHFLIMKSQFSLFLVDSNLKQFVRTEKQEKRTGLQAPIGFICFCDQ